MEEQKRKRQKIDLCHSADLRTRPERGRTAHAREARRADEEGRRGSENSDASGREGASPPASASTEPGHSTDEVAQDFFVTRERIRQIEAKALKKLRHPTRVSRLKTFLD